MIIARSPLRISFAGGGTDIPEFYRHYGPGVVVSTSIDKHVYVTLNRKFGGGVSVRYRVHENRDTVEQIEHKLIRKCLSNYGIKDGVELVIISDVPASGSGLGASSALACALVAALDRFEVGGQRTKEFIAGKAAHIEISEVGSPIGKQDHYASAFGGLNMFRFDADGYVNVERFESKEFVNEIESQSMLFYLDIQHTYVRTFTDDRTGKEFSKEVPDSSFVPKILHDQIRTIEQKRRVHELQRDNALNLWEHMRYEVPERFIDHVNENWRLKRTVHDDISSEKIDSIIQRAYASGATAAKVCGAGGGGFVYFVVPRSMQDEVRSELSELKELRFRFDNQGTQVIFDDTGTEAVLEAVR